MSQLAILVPSRGRPQNIRRLAAAVAATAQEPYTIYVRTDQDDPSVYPELPGVSYVQGPRVRYAASTNELAWIAARGGATHFALLGDDVVPETPAWDQLMIAALEDRMGVVYGSDGLEAKHGPELPTHVVIPVEMFFRLGWVILPSLRHLFADNVWRELGKGVGNFVYLPHVKLTHLHPWAGLSEVDQTYAEANDNLEREKDKAAFEAWRDGPGRENAIAVLNV